VFEIDVAISAVKNLEDGFENIIKSDVASKPLTKTFFHNALI
jgi:hypothetical protein